MFTIAYYKIAGHWYLDAPDFLEEGGNPDDLERFGDFHDFLELAAKGASSVSFTWDTKPFEGADHCDLIGSSGGKTGGYYRLSRFREQPVELELWLNTLIFVDREELPLKIYFKQISPS